MRPVTLALLVALAAPGALACGPERRDCRLTTTVHPGPLEPFAAGAVGVVQPTWARSYRIVAYRHFAGLGMTAEQQRGAVALWRQRLWLMAADEASGPGPAAWLRARELARVASPSAVDPYRRGSDWASTLNCHDDAFGTAAATLTARVAELGADSPEVRAWLEAQDAVFRTCARGGSIPEPLPPSAPPRAQQDRAYQIASALMYLGRHDDARAAFEAIATDASSPWRLLSRFLVARVELRRALWTHRVDPADAARAEGALNRALADPELAPWHGSATRLRHRLHAHAAPASRLRQAFEGLSRADDDELGSDLGDATFLTDVALGAWAPWHPAFDVSPLRARSDLLDWVLAWEEPDAGVRALDRWRATRATPWLVAALRLAPPDARSSEELVAAARALPADSPARASAVHGAAARLVALRPDEARALLDEELSRDLPRSARNALLVARLPLARDAAEWWRLAQRVPAACSWQGGMQLPDPDDARAGDVLVDADGAAGIAGLPLARVVEAAGDAAIARPLRRRLAMAAWTRAVLLDDAASAEPAATLLRALAPETAAPLDAWRAAPPEARRFAGAVALLRMPGASPDVRARAPREPEPFTERDSHRDNWWCAGRLVEAAPPAFLPEREREEALAEWRRIAAQGDAPVALGAIVLAFAKERPADGRVPEALHRVVSATRHHGCHDESAAHVSRAAFELLHRRYPKSPWTRRTPDRY